MAAEYDFRRRPSKKEDEKEQPYYPRIVSKGTVSTAELVRDISEATTFNAGDLEGVLVSLTDRIAHYLSEGYHVELGEIGYFSASLKARPVMDKQELHSQSVSFDNINFRASSYFRKLAAGRLKRAENGFQESTELPVEKREQLLIEYLHENPFITRRDYTYLTGLLKGKALRELNSLVEKKRLETRGRGSHKVYILATEE